MKKEFIFTLVLLISITGCWRKRWGCDSSSSCGVASSVDIPTAQEQDCVRSFFEEDLNEFTQDLMSNIDISTVSSDDVAQMYDSSDDFSDFSWEEDTQTNSFKTIYFDFNSDKIRKDQEEALAYNVELAKQILQEHEGMGTPAPTFVIEGHACASAGKDTYNFGLSERRAKILQDRLVALGIPQENIKIIGRGSEMPAIVDGKIVDGDRKAQWPNRRDEIRVIYA